jgi:hypothetical protein
MADRRLIEQAERFKAALEQRDLAELRRVIEAYTQVTQRLQAEIDALILKASTLENPTRGQIMKLAQYKQLLREATNELEKFQSFMGVELGTIGRGMVGRGLTESAELIKTALSDQGMINADLVGLNSDAIERLLGFLDRNGPLYGRLAQMAPTTITHLERAIVESIALGKNPRTWAAEITKAFGIGLTDSLRMARTVQLWSYREATRANYVANSSLVRGWVWYAKLDGLTCLSCIAMHGTEHDLSEPLNDHHNGRCVAIPMTILDRGNPVDQTGRDWFESQPEAQQKAMMGPGRFEAWKAGSFDFASLTKTHDDDVYGTMRVESALKDLISD